MVNRQSIPYRSKLSFSEEGNRECNDESPEFLMYQRPRPRVENRTKTPDQPPPTRPENTDLSPARPATEDGTVIEMEGVYIISVAARILDMHPQTLRKYERLGMISPGRTIGMLRLYSTEDIKKVRLIRYLSD
ncbi:MAG: MerR family transcriptional regulator, partial [Chloroflexi bacterium]|nr:MerR family transcriptional regulator [Chloroflexota bacterium]